MIKYKSRCIYNPVIKKLQLHLAYSKLVVIHDGIHSYVLLGKNGRYVSFILKLLEIC